MKSDRHPFLQSEGGDSKQTLDDLNKALVMRVQDLELGSEAMAADDFVIAESEGGQPANIFEGFGDSGFQRGGMSSSKSKKYKKFLSDT